MVGDLMRRMHPELIIHTKEWAEMAARCDCRTILVTDDELCKVSFLKTPQQVLALFPLSPGLYSDSRKGKENFSGSNTYGFPCIGSSVSNEETVVSDCDDFDRIVAYIDGRLCLALDGVQDPGNLGTIVRVADWFGIDTILCSHDTADIYNPKVVQATMGSIARVNVIYIDLPVLFDKLPSGFPVYGTLLDGSDIYSSSLTTHGIIVMGNEGNGISKSVRDRVTNRLLIPSFASGDTAESLNVAIATAIVCSEFRRNTK